MCGWVSGGGMGEGDLRPPSPVICKSLASRPGCRVEKRPGEYCLRAQKFLIILKTLDNEPYRLAST